jgi:hypothetical protein
MTILPAALAFTILAFQGQHGAVDYRRLIDDYAATGGARAPRELMTWPAAALVDAVAEVLGPHPAPRGPFHPFSTLDALLRWLEAAALVHLEAGWLEAHANRPGRAAPFVESGRMLIDRLRALVRENGAALGGGRKAADLFAARWLAAGGALLQGTTDLATAHRHFALAVKAYPRDPQLRLGLGTVSELTAANATLTVLSESSARVDHSREAYHYRRALLLEAEEQFAAALNLDPSLHEARLRMGRVLMLFKRRTEAAAQLEPIRTAKPTPELTYLACTLLARAMHEQGRGADAERLYQEALAARPDGQRAAVGLSHARWLQGLPVTTAFLRRAGVEYLPDPWTLYGLGQAPALPEAIAGLRKLVLP